MDPIRIHRLSHILHNLGVPLVPRILKAINFLIFKCVLPPECQIGDGTKLWHSGLGIIIHPDVTIGKNCNIYNFVVIGGGNDGPNGPPLKIIIGDNCNISTGAKILCKSELLTIGDNATIAANAVVISSIPANVIAGGCPAKVLKHK